LLLSISIRSRTLEDATETTMTKPKPKTTTRLMSGKNSLFRGKIRAPVTLTLTKAHHEMVKRAMKRLGLTRADLIALLIDRHADTIELPRRLTTREHP
jgi:hypothetical protein